MHKVTWVAVALAVSLALAATPAGALTITPLTPGDYDILQLPPGLGTPLFGPDTSHFYGRDPVTLATVLVADLDGTVWNLGGKYIYALNLTPHETNISQFGTAFVVSGLYLGNITAPNSTVLPSVGYSFGNALSAGATNGATAFYIESVDGDLTWYRTGNFWNNLQPITFFFTSDNPPGLNDTYSLINALYGETTNRAPGGPPGVAVPEPSSLVLLGAGFLAFGFVRRSFRHIR